MLIAGWLNGRHSPVRAVIWVRHCVRAAHRHMYPKWGEQHEAVNKAVNKPISPLSPYLSPNIRALMAVVLSRVPALYPPTKRRKSATTVGYTARLAADQLPLQCRMSTQASEGLV